MEPIFVHAGGQFLVGISELWVDLPEGCLVGYKAVTDDVPISSLRVGMRRSPSARCGGAYGCDDEHHGTAQACVDEHEATASVADGAFNGQVRGSAEAHDGVDEWGPECSPGCRAANATSLRRYGALGR
jgi:hypothetical protein